MYRRPRRKRHIGWLAAIIAFVLLALGAWGLFRLLAGTPDLDKNAVLLPTPEKEGVFAWKDGVLCVYGTKLICNDLKGNSLWTSDLPANGMKACREGDLTVAWGGTATGDAKGSLALLDKYGVIKFWKETPGEVVMAIPGVTTVAAVIKEENQHRLRVYSAKDGSDVDEALFPFASVLGAGYFGDRSSQIWVLTVDSHGSEPVTRLMTITPGKPASGGTEITLPGEVGYEAILQDKFAWIVGTHSLSFWEHAVETKTKPRMLVYGWNLQDVLSEAGGHVSFLFSPSGGSGLISSLWYVNTDGVEYRFPLPAGCIKAMLKDNGRICVLTGRGVWSMARDGSGGRFYPLANSVESVPAVVPGKAFVIQTSHRNYLIDMP